MSAEFDSENFDMQANTEDERLWDLLSAYADGETTPEESALVEAHLRSDAAYARDFAFLQAASRQVMLAGEVEPPTHLRDAIFAATIHKPTFARRLAAAWGDFRTVLSPRYAYPAGALAAGVFAAFLLWPRPAGTNNGTTDSSGAIVALPKEESVPPIVPPDVKIAPPKLETLKKPTIAANNQPKTKAVPPVMVLQPKDFLGIPAGDTPSGKTVVTVAERKSNTLKPKNTLSPTVFKTTDVKPKIVTAVDKTSAPMPTKTDKGEMYTDFHVQPNMDRENQRIIVDNDPPAEPLPGDDATPETVVNPPASAPAAETSKTFVFRSGRKLPDLRRLATALPSRSEKSGFQQGMTHTTILAMQREEIAGNTVTRF
jgi:hypothetical protein